MNKPFTPIDTDDLFYYIFYWNRNGVENYQFADHNEVFHSIVSLCRFLINELGIDICSVNYLRTKFAYLDHVNFINMISGGY